jgi:transposase
LQKFCPHLDIEIVKRSDQVSGFVVLTIRWIVERTIAWLNRCERLAKDWENLNRKVLAPRLNPPHAQKTLQSGLNSPDGLLEIRS